jgi:hypothetical protein
MKLPPAGPTQFPEPPRAGAATHTDVLSMSPANGGDRDDVDLAPVSGVVQAFPLPSTDDTQLVQAAAAGHPGAARVIWDRYARLVRSLLRRSMGPEGEVEDLLQEVFLRFFERAGTLRDMGALRSFVVGITLRVARDALRKRRVRRILSLTDSGSCRRARPRRTIWAHGTPCGACTASSTSCVLRRAWRGCCVTSRATSSPTSASTSTAPSPR